MYRASEILPMQTPPANGNNEIKKCNISLEIRFLGACLLAALSDGDMRRAVAQAEEGADLYEETWQNRQTRFEKERIRSAVEGAGIRKNWSSGIQYITGENRRDRAEQKFNQYCQSAGFTDNVVFRCGVEDPITGNQITITRGLKDWREQGFVDEELHGLKQDFDRLKKIACKGNLTKARYQTVNPLYFTDKDH
jgi:hypothetical protein